MTFIDGVLSFISKIFKRVRNIFRQANHSKKQAQEAEQLAKEKKLFQSASIAKQVLSSWSSHPSLFERFIRLLALGNLLEELAKQLAYWQKQLAQAKELASRAQTLEAQDRGNPLEIEELSKALELYQNCNSLVYEPQMIATASRLAEEINCRRKFQSLYTQGKKEAQQKFFKQALRTFLEAQKLYSTSKLETEIANCQLLSQEQEKYETAFQQAYDCAKSGRFQEALALFEPIHAQFTRTDGEEFLKKILRIIRGKESFRFGLLAEKNGQLGTAKSMYQDALKQLPELTECRVRLGIVAFKSNNLSQAVSSLNRLSGEQANYVRGLAYAKQGSWQQAQHEWRNICHPKVATQRETLKILVQRDRLQTMEKIEQLVDSNQLELAKQASGEYIKKFGAGSLVEDNLYKHIQPRLEVQVWERENWNETVTIAREAWLEKQDITSLHNWAVASYYQAQTSLPKLENLIIAWSTALANINLDPSLKNISWLKSTTVDLNEIFTGLKHKLEASIDAVKDKDTHKYLQLRDLYRLEMAALDLIGYSPRCGMKTQGLLSITPGCYQQYRTKFPKVNFPPKTWGALYTDWGLAVAACLEGDVARAIQIKPTLNPSAEAERFAYSFVSYHEGCYHLQNYDWRHATTSLRRAKSEIKACSEWQEKIDKLCQKQRQEIASFEEHLAFAQYWYDLLGSPSAKSYLAEFKAKRVCKKIADEKISFSQALNELKEIKKIDERNPIVLELINDLEIIQKNEEINNLMKSGNFEEAVRCAKRSAHQEVRYHVAEIFIKILLEGIERRDLPPDEILQLGRWAKELCPHEPAFQDIYRSLRL